MDIHAIRNITISPEMLKLIAEIDEFRGRWNVMESLAPERLQTRGEITVKEIEESAGANRNTIKAHLRRLATDNYLAQVGKGRGARYTLKQTD